MKDTASITGFEDPVSVVPQETSESAPQPGIVVCQNNGRFRIQVTRRSIQMTESITMFEGKLQQPVSSLQLQFLANIGPM